MVRVFHNTADALPALYRQGKFCLAPHNHRQDITLTIIHGYAVNVDFSFSKQSHPHAFYEWVFRSAIVDGGIATQYHEMGDLRVTGIRPINKEPLFLPSSAIHTVVASPGSAWMVTEGRLAPKHQLNLCYSAHGDFHLTQDELYEPMTAEEIEELNKEWHNHLRCWGHY